MLVHPPSSDRLPGIGPLATMTCEWGQAKPPLLRHGNPWAFDSHFERWDGSLDPTSNNL